MGTKTALVLVHSVLTLRLTVLVLTIFFRRIPRKLKGAAMLDGCGRLQVFRYVFLPLARTSILATGLFAFVLSYAEFLFALVLSGGAANRPLAVVMAALTRNTDVSWGLLNASVFLAVLPTVALVAEALRGRGSAPGRDRGLSPGSGDRPPREVLHERDQLLDAHAQDGLPLVGRGQRGVAQDAGRREISEVVVGTDERGAEEIGRLPRRRQRRIAGDRRRHVNEVRMQGELERRLELAGMTHSAGCRLAEFGRPGRRQLKIGDGGDAGLSAPAWPRRGPRHRASRRCRHARSARRRADRRG